jgi:hypothetical protein
MNKTESLFSSTPVTPDWHDRYMAIADDYLSRFNMTQANYRNAAAWDTCTGEIYAELEKQFPRVEHPLLWNNVAGPDTKPCSSVMARIHA